MRIADPDVAHGAKEIGALHVAELVDVEPRAQLVAPDGGEPVLLGDVEARRGGVAGRGGADEGSVAQRLGIVPVKSDPASWPVKPMERSAVWRVKSPWPTCACVASSVPSGKSGSTAVAVSPTKAMLSGRRAKAQHGGVARLDGAEILEAPVGLQHLLAEARLEAIEQAEAGPARVPLSLTAPKTGTLGRS